VYSELVLLQALDTQLGIGSVWFATRPVG